MDIHQRDNDGRRIAGINSDPEGPVDAAAAAILQQRAMRPTSTTNKGRGGINAQAAVAPLPLRAEADRGVEAGAEGTGG